MARSAPSTSTGIRRRTIALAGILAGGLVLVMLFQAWLLTVSRERALDFIAVRAANRAQANANQVAAVFRQLDLILRDVRGHVDPDEVGRGPDPARPERVAAMHRLIAEHKSWLPALLNLHVIAPDGSFVFSAVDPLPVSTVADRPYFHEHRASSEDRLRVSQPLLGRISKRWSVFSSRRIAAADGSFAGIVLAGIDADSLSRVMGAVDQQQWTLALVSREGLLAARQPSLPEQVGRPVDDASMAWLQGPATTRNGSGIGAGDTLIWGRSPVEDLPLVAVAGYSRELALAQWRRDLKAHILAAALLAAGAIAVLVLHTRRELSAHEAEVLDQRLRSSERTLAELAQRIPVGVFRVRSDPSGACTAAYASPRCHEILRLPAFDQANLLAAVEEADRPALRTACERARLVDEFSWSGRIRIAGSVRWLEISASTRDPAGGTRSWNGVVQDITAKREAEAALQRQQDLLLAVFGNAPIGICLIEPERKVIASANPAACSILGRSAEALVGSDQFAFAHLDDLGPAQAAEARASQPGAPPQRITIRSSTGDNRTIDLEMVLTSIRDDQGQRLNGLALFHDVTEEKRLSAQLRQSEKMQAVGLLAGGIAHDFNNILGGISGFTELARRRHPPEPVASHLVHIAAAADRAKTLVQQILTFSRRGPSERVPVHLQSTVREVLNLLRATLPATVTMVTDLAPDLQPVLADPGRIHQVLMNLCGNAVHAMGGRGELRVTLDRVTLAAPLHGRMRRLEPGTYARITVADTGCGMEPSTLERIFEPFFTTKGPHEGTGLGLAVVWGVVETHDGDIQVESHPGRGTAFRILLPVIAVAAVGEPAAIAADERLPGGRERLLIVDDEPTLRNMFSEMMRELGYAVETCANGREALSKLREDPQAIDLVITDQTMPGMTGSEFAAAAAELRPDLAVILCSGLDCTPVEGAPADGLRHYVMKPVNLNTLARLVRRVLDRPRA